MYKLIYSKMEYRNVSREIKELKELIAMWKYDRELVYRKRNEYEVGRHRFCVKMITFFGKELKEAECVQEAM